MTKYQWVLIAVTVVEFTLFVGGCLIFDNWVDSKPKGLAVVIGTGILMLGAYIFVVDSVEYKEE